MTDEITGKSEIKKLPCRLTQEEFNVRATEFASLDGKLDELEAERKRQNDAIKDEIGGVNSERARLRKIVLSRVEERDVPCTWHADWASKSVLLRRDDTGEVVQARTMTADEVQTSFDLTSDDKRLPPESDDGKPLA